MRRLTIRWRLTLWYGAVLALSLAVFGGIVYGMFAHNLLGEIDRALDEELTEIQKDVQSIPDEKSLLRQLQSEFGNHEFYEIQVVRSSGDVFFNTPGISGRPLPIPDKSDHPGETQKLDFKQSVGRDYRMGVRGAVGPAGTFVIQAADTLQLYERELNKLFWVLCGTVPIVLGGALGGGYWLSRQALAPVDRLTHLALELSATRLDRRVAIENCDDELGRLALAFNQMLERLERSFDDMRRFTADAAHELRTPLAVLRTEAEVALRSLRTPAEYSRTLENQLEELARLARLADQLLFLSREDAGLQRPSSGPVTLHELLADLTEHLQAAAEAAGVSLSCKRLPPAIVHSDPDRLRRLFFNLLDNAIKYTPSGGTIRIYGELVPHGVHIHVEDSGIGIPPEHLPHVFERFYRVDSVRNPNTDGTGLGLAICRSIVEAHAGAIRIESRVGGGTHVHVTLPAQAAPAVAAEELDACQRSSGEPALATR